MRTIAALFFLLLSASVSAQSPEVERDAATLTEQGPALQSLLRRHREGQVSDALAVEVLRGAQALEAQGLPAEPYLLKANEALAKKVPPRRMTPALQVSEERIRTAADLADSALKQGAKSDPAARRQAILQLDSALRGGSSPGELQSGLKRGFAGKDRPNLLDLTEEAVLPAGKKRKKNPVLPSQEFRSGSEKPGKAFGPKEPKSKPQSSTVEKQQKPVKFEVRKSKGFGQSSGKGNSHKNQGPKRSSPKRK